MLHASEPMFCTCWIFLLVLAIDFISNYHVAWHKFERHNKFFEYGMMRQYVAPKHVFEPSTGWNKLWYWINFQIFGQLMSQKVKNLHIINKFQYTFSTTFVSNQKHTICMEIMTTTAGLWAASWLGKFCQFAPVLNKVSLWQFAKVLDSRHVTNSLRLSSCQPWC